MIELLNSKTMIVQCPYSNCRNKYNINIDATRDILEGSVPECECGQKRHAGFAFSNFFKYFNRLRDMDESVLRLKLNRFVFNNQERFFGVELTCLDCGKVFIIYFPKIRKISQEPGLFHCPKCKKTDRTLKLVKEFFLCLRWVIELSCDCPPWQYHFDVHDISKCPAQDHLLLTPREVSYNGLNFGAYFADKTTL